MIKILKQKKIKNRYSRKWHTLIISKRDLRIELDSIEFWQKDLPKKFEYFDFDGLIVKTVSLNNLKRIYKKAAEISDNPEKNRKKYEALKSLK